MMDGVANYMKKLKFTSFHHEEQHDKPQMNYKNTQSLFQNNLSKITNIKCEKNLIIVYS
jgi:hypothetical protein